MCIVENNPVSICMAMNRSRICTVLLLLLLLSVLCVCVLCAQYNTEMNENGEERERVEKRYL